MKLSSDQNPLLKRVRKAVSRGSLTGDGLAVAEGPHLLEEAIASRAEIEAVIVTEGLVSESFLGDEVGAAASRNRRPELERLFRHLGGGAQVFTVDERTFAGLSATEAPQGVIALVRPSAHTIEQMLRPEGGPSLLLVLEGIQDPGNAGAMLRAAEAFGATGVVFLKGCVNPYNPKCLRGSAGSIFRVPVVSGVAGSELLDVLRAEGAQLYAADPQADDAVSSVDLRGASALLIGSEGRGIGAELSASAVPVRIPTKGVESLNAAVAAGVLLYEVQQQRSDKGTARVEVGFRIDAGESGAAG